MVITAEIGKAANSFMITMRDHPLALALVIMNFALLAYLFYNGHATLTRTSEYARETQYLLSKCVSVEDFEKLLKATGK